MAVDSVHGNMLKEKFFSLIRLGLGSASDTDRSLTVQAEEWSVLYKMAKEQALLGVVLDGVQQLPPDMFPPNKQLLYWIGVVEVMKRRNQYLNEQCVEIIRRLENVGITSCLLKGQGVAAMYPNPLVRNSGDIDLWCWLTEGRRDEVDRNVGEMKRRVASLNEGTLGKMVYHHIEWSLPKLEVEVHYRSVAFNNPFVNRRFQKWATSNDRFITSNPKLSGINTPSDEFNVVFLLAHIYHHILFEGVGLRQVCDYFVLLRNAKDDFSNMAPLLSSLNMLRFARGMMWVLGNVFLLEREKMIVEPDESEGRFILSEMMQAGNFGTYDTRQRHELHKSRAGIFWLRTRHRMRFLTHYSGEVLWDIPFRFYNWFWRKRFA